MRTGRLPPDDVQTRFSCERTDGYNVERGSQFYEWCPFCGYRTDDDRHEFLVTPFW